MKKTALTLFILLITIPLISSTYNKREQWWKINLRILQKEYKLISQHRIIDKKMKNIINEEIKSAKNILAIFERNNKKDGSLNHKGKLYSENDIAKLCNKHSKSLFSLYLMEHMYLQINNYDNVIKVRNEVHKTLNKIIKDQFSQTNKALAKQIIVEHITKAQWKNLAFESFMIEIINNKNILLNNFSVYLKTSISSDLQKKYYQSNEKELHNLLLKAVKSYTTKNRFNVILSKRNLDISHSWQWKNIEKNIKKELQAYSKIIKEMKLTQPYSLQKVRFYYKNPVILEKLIFSSIKENYIINKSYPLPELSKKNFMTIPTEPNFSKLQHEINLQRQYYLTQLKGKENNDFFREINNKFESLITLYTRKAQKVFFKEKDRVRLLSNNSQKLKNQKKFYRAYKLFNDKLKLTRSYTEKSIEFLKFINSLKTKNSSQLLTDYRYKLEKNNEYASFIRSLIRDASQTWIHKDSYIFKDYLNVIRQYRKIYGTISRNFYPERKILSHFNKTEILIIRKEKSAADKYLALSRGAIRFMYSDYMTKWREVNKKAVRKTKHLNKQITQYEIDILYKNLKRYTEAYNKMNTTRSLFNQYSASFYEVFKYAKKGLYHKDLEKVLKKRSIFAITDSSLDKKIYSQYLNKRYLRKKARISYSRIISLLRYYKRARIEIQDAPDRRELEILMNQIKKTDSIKIVSWRMNEFNYKSVDHSIAKYLNSVFRKKMWAKKYNPRNGNDIVIKINNSNSSISVPAGWRTQETGYLDQQRGVLKYMTSFDRKASLKIISSPLHNKTLKDVAEEWASRSGAQMKIKKWHKNSRLPKLTIISTDLNRNIIITTSIKKKNKAIIIRGKTKRSNYRYFKRKFDAIVESLN